jgi:hypothetical protein
LHKDFIATTMTDLEKAIAAYRVAKAHFERALTSPSGTPDLFNQAKAEIAMTDKTIDQIEKFVRAQKERAPSKKP